MKISTIVMLAVMGQLVPVTLHACDCGCGDSGPPPIHFKDGIAPNGPVVGGADYADPAYYNSSFAFRDYGPARVVIPPPAPAPPTRPSS
jgi:hypothetical protein